MVDAHGRLVGESLLLGARCCRLHMQLFCAWPLRDFEDDGPPLIFFLDFETTGLDILEHHIVEIGVVSSDSGACFSTVVCPPKFVVNDELPVHGIPDDELREGPPFGEAFHRLHRFCEHIVETSVVNETDDEVCDSPDHDAARPPVLRETPPGVIICAHNGTKFDFPFLCSECLRSGVGID